MNSTLNTTKSSTTGHSKKGSALKPKNGYGLRQMRSTRAMLLETLENRCMLSGVLGTASAYAVLAGSTVTNTGATAIFGNVGVSPGSAITGFPPGVVSGGAIEANNGSAVQAHADLATAYGVIAGEAFIPANNLTGTDLGGLTLTPGVYHFDTAAQLTGTLTLDAEGNPNARFDFQIGTTLTTASASAITMINGGLADNVYFQVGSSATLGVNTAFEGNILADQSVTLNTNASMTQGRAMAIIGAVTLDTNPVSATQADISVTNSTAVGTLLAGNNISYTITVTNGGPNVAQTIDLSDVIPTGTTFVSDVQTAGPAFTLTNPAVGSGGTIDGTIASLASGASATFTVVAQVPSSTTSGTSIVDVANVSTVTQDPSLANNTATVTKSVLTSSNLSLTNSTSSATVVAGDTITYTLTVSNAGPSDAQTVQISDTVPAGTTFVSDNQTSGPAFTLTSPAAGGTGTINGTRSTLASGASATFSVVVLVPAGATGGTSIADSASVTTATTDPNLANNSQTVTTGVVTPPAITSGTSTTFNIGTPGTFTITTTGYPTATISSSALTAGLTFVDNHNGTATLSGTPTAGTSGIYTLTFTATNGTSPSAAQSFTLTVDPMLVALVVSAPANNVNPGAALQFTATGTDENGASIALGAVVWSLDAGSLGTVDQNGLFTAGSAGGGTATIRATSGGHTAALTIAINAIPLTHLTQITHVQTLGSSQSITGFVVSFNGALDPTTAQDVAGYRILRQTTVRRSRNFWQQLFGRNAGTETQYTPFKIGTAVYDSQTDTVTLTLASPMAVKDGVRVLEVMGTGVNAVLDTNGKIIDGDSNGKAGGNYIDRFSMTVAKSITYQTITGETVKLSVTGPGEMVSLLPADTKTPVIDLVGTESASSVLTGQIRKGRNSVALAVLDELNGTATVDNQLGSDFQVNVNNA
jgi:uncharacterized repeat protein (TIGR01451 family)